MRIAIEHLSEPELVFRNGKRGIEPRRALTGSRTAGSEHAVTLGIVGPPEDAVAVRKWLERLGSFQVAREPNTLRYRN